MKTKLSSKITPNERNLIKRYLIWCYKTTKEDLDRIDRYYTQLQVDHFILDKISKQKGDEAYQKRVKDFEQYMFTKKDNVDQKKFKDINQQTLNADYLYLKNRFAAIEEAIGHFLGNKELKDIAELYEKEMTRRILEAKEHS